MGEAFNPALSVIMPCRNEALTVGRCVAEARAFINRRGLTAEILVVDNGSTDGSAGIAADCGARVITEPRPGYGSALRTGIAAARGSVLLMGDCDMTYDFEQMDALYDPLIRGEYDVMIGDCFAGGIETGAMPLSHRIGARLLSALGRRRAGCDVRDFHCGLRGMTGQAAKQLPFRTEGMEFATEMIALAARAGLKIGQTPVVLRRCAYPRKSKLRTLPDGFRHLKYLLVDIPHRRKKRAVQ